MSEADDLIPINAPERVSPPLFGGDPAPWFYLPSDVNPRFGFSSLGGRFVVLSFLRSFSDADGQRIIADFLAGAGRFGAYVTALILVSMDKADVGARVPEGVQGVRFLYDPGGDVARLYLPEDLKPATFLIDQRLRIVDAVPVKAAATHAAQVLKIFDAAFRVPQPEPAVMHAPVLMIPNVFEPALCEELIRRHNEAGGIETGFMIERDGVTVQEHDYSHKRRTDWPMDDKRLIEATRVRVRRRIAPEIQRAHQFTVTHIERYLVACYKAEVGGHFASHRDNTTKGTAHRRFAVSINLNDDYDGGELVFPEFGQARFKPKIGGACVFSCSLLHQATRVTRGERYVFVPFLYDGEGAAIRKENLQFLSLTGELGRPEE